MGSIRYKVDENHNVQEIHKVVVHKFKVSDAEDPDLYAAEPMCKWQESDQGQFIMEHAIDKPEWHRHLDYPSYSYQYVIVAEIEKKKLAEYYLRFGNDRSNSIR